VIRPLRLLLYSLAAIAAATAGCGGGETPVTIDVPPGELIAYTASDGIHLVTPAGGQDWRVPGATDLSGPRWSPDGRRLAAVNLSDCCKVFAVSIDGFDKEQLPLSSSTTPDWSPDATRLALFDEEDVRIHVVRIADGVTEAVIPMKGNEPAWSPDGRTIAFQSDDSGGLLKSLLADGPLRIILASSTGRDVRRLTTATGGDEGETGAAWSPDGGSIAFASDADGDFDIYVARADGSGYRKVTDNSVDDDSPSWSPDGTRLVLARTWKSKTAIVVHDVKTGEETTVATGGLDVGDLVLEPSWQPRPG
jgi:TolB protein